MNTQCQSTGFDIAEVCIIGGQGIYFSYLPLAEILPCLCATSTVPQPLFGTGFGILEASRSTKGGLYRESGEKVKL